MPRSIDENQLFQVSQILESSYNNDGFYGYIDLECGDVLIGSMQGYELELELEEEDEKFEERYLAIPNLGSGPSFNDMEEFIESLKDSDLKSRLEKAIYNKKPFANFKSIIKNSLEIENWYNFSSERQEQRAIQWLQDNNIELFKIN